ncbi:unnamed protein product [Vitrella brassicaformis CCMP3155]|uniref:Mitogen-activated protein kinase n=2 Tax=Vitrella brassicaformis TaxID=1169539 RepID=A0A0G4EWP4_VITBC|nr:unnamed protein product [Vitrella brassicaformis CCMP3155]|eukprot:CEM02683.1 unnamed protein product [Vitrella brassicaformis CCMP3155]
MSIKRRLSYWDIPDRYRLEKPLGSGAYGAVHQAFCTKEGKTVAIKKITGLFGDRFDAKRVLREICILGRLEHDHIVKIVDLCVPSDMHSFDDLFVVMELADADLGKLYRTNVFLSEIHVKTLLYNLILGVRYLHSAGVYHRDIKPANCLCYRDCSVKLCDFGLARTVEQPEDMKESYNLLDSRMGDEDVGVSTATMDATFENATMSYQLQQEDQARRKPVNRKMTVGHGAGPLARMRTGFGAALAQHRSRAKVSGSQSANTNSLSGLVSPDPQSAEDGAEAVPMEVDNPSPSPVAATNNNPPYDPFKASNASLNSAMVNASMPLPGVASSGVVKRAGTVGVHGQSRLNMKGLVELFRSRSKNVAKPKQQKLRRALTVRVVTRQYRSPELILQNEHYDEGIDVWSIGCIFGELYLMMREHLAFARMRRPLFPGTTSLMSPRSRSKAMELEIPMGDQLNCIFNVLGTPTEDDLQEIEKDEFVRRYSRRQPISLRTKFAAASDEGLDLLRRMLAFRPSQRTTLDEALDHPFFADVRSPAREFKANELLSLPFDDYADLNENQLRYAFLAEIQRYHPEMTIPESIIKASGPLPQPEKRFKKSPLTGSRLLEGLVAHSNTAPPLVGQHQHSNHHHHHQMHHNGISKDSKDSYPDMNTRSTTAGSASSGQDGQDFGMGPAPMEAVAVA